MKPLRACLLAGFVVAASCVFFLYVQDQRWRTAYDAGGAALTKASYILAEEQFSESLAAASWFGADDVRQSRSLTGLGYVYMALNKDAEAALLFQRALDIAEKRLGPDHPEVADCLSGLATAHGRRAQDAEAEPLLLRALAIREKARPRASRSRPLAQRPGLDQRQRGSLRRGRAFSAPGAGNP